MRLQYDVPDDVIIDGVTGWALNIPLGYQVPPGWHKQYPESYQHILKSREEQGIVIEDDHLVDPAPPGRTYDPSVKTDRPIATRKPKPKPVKKT